MKIIKNKEFQPVSIIIETEKELAELYMDLQKSKHLTGTNIAKKLCLDDDMTIIKANELGITNA